MAQVDFSNATITHCRDDWEAWLDLARNSYYMRDENNQDMATNVSRNVVTSGPLNGFYVTFSGTCVTSGTKIYFTDNWGSTALSYSYFEISNISYSSGDTFDFRIDISFTVE